MPSPVPHAEHIDRLRTWRDALEADVRTQFESLDAEQMTWRPTEGGWSIAECLEHLSVTAEQYEAACDEALQRAPKIRPERAPDFKGGPFMARFIKMLEPGNGRYKAPKAFQPDPGLDGLAARERFLETHGALGGIIERMESVDLRKTRVTSPALSLLKMKIGDLMPFLLTHADRHVAQAKRVLHHPDFPAAPATEG